jgi:hypothetical protein
MSKGKGIGQLKHFANQFNLEEAGLPKPVKDLLAKCNDWTVSSISIGRNPVQSAIQGILKTVSTVPYDNLFHLFMVFNCSNGKKVLLEKNARINMSMTIPSMTDKMELTNVPHYTIKEYVAKTKEYMKDKFIPYHPSSNNCQDYIISCLKANGINDGHDFVKQNTEMIFKNKGWLSSTAKSVTDLGGYADALLKGGMLKKLRARGLSNELTDGEIEELIEHLKIPGFLGCFIRDDVPKLKKGESCILNLNGRSHWTALIRLDKFYYFDSYGVIGPKILDGLDYIYSEEDMQALSSTACGFYTIAFLKAMTRGGDGTEMYQQFLDTFHDPKKNDLVLKKHFGL